MGKTSTRMQRSAITGEASRRFCRHHEQGEIFVEKVMKKRLGSHTERKWYVCQIEGEFS